MKKGKVGSSTLPQKSKSFWSSGNARILDLAELPIATQDYASLYRTQDNVDLYLDNAAFENVHFVLRNVLSIFT